MAATTMPAHAHDYEPDVVRNSARAGAPDRYLAALLAPRAVRGDLVALAAFSAEIEKIALQASEATLGEIRVQWWRDTLRAGVRGENSGHPVADAFSQTIVRHALPLEQINDHLDAASNALYADAPENDEELKLQLDLKEGVLFALAGRILGAAGLMPSHSAVHAAAQSYGLTRLGLALPYLLARGRIPLPPSLAPTNAPPDWRDSMARLAKSARMQLEHASTAYKAEPRMMKTALLPVALVEPYLRALTRKSHDPSRDLADIAPLTRAWRLATTHMRGRL